MPLIRQPIPALYGGVSQQAAVIRSANQCEEAINCFFSVAEGCGKRPPMEAIASLRTVSDTLTPYYAWINNTSTQRWLLELPGDGTFSLYDVSTGAKLSATNDTAQAYLNATNASVNFRVFSAEGTIYIVNRTITTAAASDSAPGTIAGTAQTLQDTLLDSASDGAIYKIVGDSNNTFDAYYAKKVDGKWVEWVQPGDQIKLDASTMPHAITVTDDVADFAEVVWADKLVGDEKSNKFPSFTGYGIDNIFFAHDRLGFLSGSHVCMSETGKYTNFFRTTVYDILDTDRIDVAVASDSKTFLRSAKPIHKSIVLFSDDCQFSMDGAPIFSPRTLNVTPATAYPASKNCEPTNAGPNVYFATDAGQYTHVREMFVEDQSVKLDAANVTSHVPRYVRNAADIIEAHNNMDILFVHSPNEPSTLSVYQYYWSGDQKVQSAWSKWEFGGGIKILAMHSIDHYLYVVYQFTGVSGTQRYLGRINLKFGDNGIATGFDHPVNLDHLVIQTGDYNSTENKTYFSCPFPLGDDAVLADLVFVVGSGATQGTILVPGGPVTIGATSSGFSLWLYGDHSTTPMLCGLKYDQALTLSEQFYEANQRAGLNCRVQLRNLSVSFHNTAFFKVTTTIRGHDAATESVVPGLVGTYTARTVGDDWFRLNTPQITSGVHRFPVLARSSDAIITLSNDSYLPANFQTAEWEGMVTTRTRG